MSRVAVEGFEDVVVDRDGDGTLLSVIAVHDTTLGPALGGVRVWPYIDEEAAVAECLALARAMTRKAAVAGLALGGGWSIIPIDAAIKTPQRLVMHGNAIASLKGRFIPVNDVGTDQSDLQLIGEVASPVCSQGDPSPWTALGVAAGIRACARHLGYLDLRGLRIGIQGAGNVGSRLSRLLVDAGADVRICDVVPGRAAAVAEATGAKVIDADLLLRSELDVLAPCALGGVVTDNTLPLLDCRAIAGGANDVLDRPQLADDLAARGIIYAPDFCVTSGGVIFLESQLRGLDESSTRDRVLRLEEVVHDLIERAASSGTTPTRAAEELAEARLAAARR